MLWPAILIPIRVRRLILVQENYEGGFSNNSSSVYLLIQFMLKAPTEQDLI